MVSDAALLAYQSIDDTSAAGYDCPMKAGVLPTEVSSLINKAINDGASIINYSATSPSPSEYLKWAIARAMSQGVIITTGAGNTSPDNTGSSLSQWSGVVGVSAIGTDGKFASYSSWGQGVTTAAVGAPSLRGMQTAISLPLRASLFRLLLSRAFSRRRVPSGPTRHRISFSSFSSTLRAHLRAVETSTSGTDQLTPEKC